MSIVAEVRKLVTEYGGIRERQEKELDEFRDGPGGEVVDWVRYDAARARHSEDDSERYAALVGELAKLAGPSLRSEMWSSSRTTAPPWRAGSWASPER